jgi:methylenetetrahydrofolate reductase (NADPH)
LEGERICVELIGELAHIPEIAGVHVMAPANEAALPRVIAEARRSLLGSRRRLDRTL